MTKHGALPAVLALTCLLFIGILVGSYVMARQANPVILDEHGYQR